MNLHILKAAEFFHTEIQRVPYEKILTVQTSFQQSEFVRKILGVGCVAEPCGYLASDKGIRLSNKIMADGITLCLWKEE